MQHRGLVKHFAFGVRWLASAFEGGGKPPHSEGIPFAFADVMSRVELKEQPPKREAKEQRKPSQAEGDEKDVDEALRREEQKRPED